MLEQVLQRKQPASSRRNPLEAGQQAVGDHAIEDSAPDCIARNLHLQRAARSPRSSGRRAGAGRGPSTVASAPAPAIWEAPACPPRWLQIGWGGRAVPPAVLPPVADRATRHDDPG